MSALTATNFLKKIFLDFLRETIKVSIRYKVSEKIIPEIRPRKAFYS